MFQPEEIIISFASEYYIYLMINDESSYRTEKDNKYIGWFIE